MRRAGAVSCLMRRPAAGKGGGSMEIEERVDPAVRIANDLDLNPICPHTGGVPLGRLRCSGALAARRRVGESKTCLCAIV